MPSIEISRDQAAYVEALREELSETVTYGHVRTQDALQYLIDHHREDGDLDVEVDADVEFDGGRAVEADSGGPGTDGEHPGDTAAGSADGGAREDGSTGGTTVVESADALRGVGPDGGSGGGSAADGATDGGGADGGDDGGGGGDGEERTGDPPETVADSGDEKVSEMLNLVEEHDDKWTDGESGYEVELPDGEVETVQTKDDVRAILFKNYR